MKYAVIIGDGMADEPIAKLGGKTPIEAANTPNLDTLCARGEIGLVKTVPDGLPPGSDTAILSIFGYDPTKYFTGRSPLEAAGSGVLLKDGEASFRTNMVALDDAPVFENKKILSHSGDNIEGNDAIALMEALLQDAQFCDIAKEIGMRFVVNPSFRHVGIVEGKAITEGFTPPHNILGQKIGSYLELSGDAVSQVQKRMMKRAYEVLDSHPINEKRRAQGHMAANSLWFWGAGYGITLPSFIEKYHKTAMAVTAVPLVAGIAALSGFESAKVEGATGDIDTNYEGKVDAALHALKGGADFVIVHIEAPDECAHMGDMELKLRAIELLDEKVVGPLAKGMEKLGAFRLVVLSDHPTLLSTRTHDAAPVPYLLYDSSVDTGSNTAFCEKNAAHGDYIEKGHTLLDKLFSA